MTHTTSHANRNTPTAAPVTEPARMPLPQYSLARILGTWAAAALPMAALAWVVAPWLAGSFEGTSALPRAIILSLTAGLVWQFGIVMVLIRREQGIAAVGCRQGSPMAEGPTQSTHGATGRQAVAHPDPAGARRRGHGSTTEPAGPERA